MPLETTSKARDIDDLSHIVQQPGESARQPWTRYLIKKNQIVDCPDAEALAAFKQASETSGLPDTLAQKSQNPWQPSPHL